MQCTIYLPIELLFSVKFFMIKVEKAQLLRSEQKIATHFFQMSALEQKPTKCCHEQYLFFKYELVMDLKHFYFFMFENHFVGNLLKIIFSLVTKRRDC